jgi:hypothetical protein
MPNTYDYMYREVLPGDLSWCGKYDWDTFVSAFNLTERVQRVYDSVRARRKVWVIHAEYGLSGSMCPAGSAVFSSTSKDEDTFIQELVDTQLSGIEAETVCIDISGFMRPHVMYMIRLLREKGIKRMDLLYSEPVRYRRQENAEFSAGDFAAVRPVRGFEGSHEPSLGSADDLLVLGAGYEHNLLTHVASAKSNAQKVQILAFPPLQLDFYQQNVLNAYQAAEAVKPVNEGQPEFAPASDPFATASVLSRIVRKHQKQGAKNEGLVRTWKYTLEF